MKAAEKSSLYRELAKLTQADFHLDRSLQLLLSQKKALGTRSFLEGIQKGLEEGKGLAEAIRSYNQKLVSPLELTLIEAGEKSGRLSPAFHHLARYYASVDSAAQQMRGAMIYPLLLLHLAIILPELPNLLVSPQGSEILLRLALWIILLWVVLITLSFLAKWLSKKAQTSASLDTQLNRIPWIGTARQHWAMARFTQVFHAGLLAALRMSEICRLAGDASQSGRLKQGAYHAAELIEANGESLSLALADSGVFDSHFINSTATAEEVGQLDDEMARWMATETTNASDAMGRASLWLPKVCYGIVVAFVAYRIITMLQSYYGEVLKLMDG